jgi:Tol biopolymer transport system component
MTDRHSDLRVDDLLRRLDIPARPDESYASASLGELLPLVRRARSADASAIGRVRRDLGVLLRPRAWGAWPRRTALGGVLILIALILAALLIVVVGSRRHLPPPFGLAANGQIAFVRDGKLVLENPDGSVIVTVQPQTTSLQAAPAYSRDGTKIVYMNAVSSTQSSGSTDRFDVVVADADGSHPVVVAHDVVAGAPIWSPDGRWLVWSGSDDHAFVASADGSGVTDIGKIGAGAWTPSWAPDSQHLAVAAADGILWLVNRDGTGARRLSRGQYDEVGEKGWSADWSPDGSKLLFGGLVAGVQSLYLVGLDGAPERLVSTEAWNGVWSPDGSMIAYVRRGIPDATKLVIADANGRQIRVLDGDHG